MAVVRLHQECGIVLALPPHILIKEEEKTDAEKVDSGKFLFENHRNE
jgi:hypothetical protein